jgi:hypothetical protein
MLPLAVEEAEADPSVRMHECTGSLFIPLDMMAWSPSGVYLFCRGIASPLADAACPLAYGIVGGARVPKLRRVTADGAPVSPGGIVAAAFVSHIPPV